MEEALFKKYYKPLCHFAWQLLGDEEAAKDVVQDSFMNYFDRIDQVSSEEAAIRQFLYSSVKFASYNKIRHEKVGAKYILTLPRAEERFADDIEHQFIRSEVLAEVNKIIELMPVGCKTVFKKGYLEGLSVKEIAEELQISVNTVKTQRQRAMKIIFNRLDPEMLAALFVISKII